MYPSKRQGRRFKQVIRRMARKAEMLCFLFCCWQASKWKRTAEEWSRLKLAFILQLAQECEYPSILPLLLRPLSHSLRITERARVASLILLAIACRICRSESYHSTTGTMMIKCTGHRTISAHPCKVNVTGNGQNTAITTFCLINFHWRNSSAAAAVLRA